MDIKLGGISKDILREALYQAGDGIRHILRIMEDAKKKIVINYENIPSLSTFIVPVNKIVDIIGQGGKTIKEIIERFAVNIDLVRESGEVKIMGESGSNVEMAKEYILELIKGDSRGYGEKPQKVDYSSYKVGEVFAGVVKKVTDFGSFISLPNGGDGLLHISKITKSRDEKIEQYMKEGDPIKCEILSINGTRIELGIVSQ